MQRFLIFAYTIVCYLLFLATFTYLIAFVSGIFVPKTVNSGEPGSMVSSLAINFALVALFAIQHLIMARPKFKRRWTQIIPPAAERSTFVLATCLALIALYYFWQPLGGTLWSVEQGFLSWTLIGLATIGWGTVLYTSFLINHFHLFGLQQGWAALHGREVPEPAFQTPSLYRMVRHPMMLGMFLALWCTPVMSGSQFVLAALMTTFVFISLNFEERELKNFFGERYAQYQRDVPMVFPRLRRGVARHEEDPVAQLQSS